MDFHKVLNKVSHHRLSRILNSLETKRHAQIKYWKETAGGKHQALQEKEVTRELLHHVLLILSYSAW